MEITNQTPFPIKKTSQTADTVKEAKLHKACEDFEAIMIKQLQTTMRKSIPEGGIFDGGYAKDMFQNMQDDELAKKMASSGGMGIGEVLYNQISGINKTTTVSRQP